MDSPKDSISVLVKRLIDSKDAGDQVQIAMQLSRMEPESGRDIQMLNRAIYYFRDRHPDAYDRAKKPDLRLYRSIPPAPDGGETSYIRREEACTMLVKTRSKWKDALKQKKTGAPFTRQNLDREEFTSALRDMDAAGRGRGRPPHAKPADTRKPKRRLHP